MQNEEKKPIDNEKSLVDEFTTYYGEDLEDPKELHDLLTSGLAEERHKSIKKAVEDAYTRYIESESDAKQQTLQSFMHQCKLALVAICKDHYFSWDIYYRITNEPLDMSYLRMSEIARLYAWHYEGRLKNLRGEKSTIQDYDEYMITLARTYKQRTVVRTDPIVRQ